MQTISKVFFLILVMFSTNLKGQQKNDSLLIELVHTNQLGILDSLVNQSNVNETIGSSQEPLLFYAIQENNLDVVKLVIKKGAYIDLLFNDLSALMYCAIKGKTEIGEYLLGIGVNVNGLNSRRNTALIYAARYGRLSFVKMLLDNGANTEIKNLTNLSALDYAEKFSEVEVSELIRLATENKYIPFKASFQDGPYVKSSILNYYSVEYLQFDSSAQKFSRTKNTFQYKRGAANVFINSILGEVPIYFKQRRSTQFHVKDYSKIFAVGDVHGEFDSLGVLLQKNGVIDQNFNWIFGDGILVFVGDIFDRGNKVTETLWLLYKLQNQAEDRGGNLFWTLGNHDLMALQGDTRYLNNNYLLLTSKNRTTYKELFDTESVLGRWIRRQHTVVQIDNILFSHAGISPLIAKNKFKLAEINSLVADFLNRRELDPLEIEKISIITGENGLFWYRGYMQETSFSKKLENVDVAEINSYFDVNVQVFGHTEVDQVTPSYENMVIPINVPFASPRISMQALFIQDGKFYRARRNGEREYLFSKSKK